MKRLTFIIVLLLLVCAPIYGATWYVDATAGNDANPGTIAEPWQTTVKADSAAAVQAGDTILLKRSEVWKTQIVVPQNTLTYGAYGAGERPIIWGIWGNSADNITVQDIEVTGNIYVSGDDWVIERVITGRDAVSFSVSGDATLDFDAVGAENILWQYGSGYTSTADDPGVVNVGTTNKLYHSVSADWVNISNFRLSGHSGLRMDLSQFRDVALTNTLDLYNCSLVTGDLADLPALTNSIYLNNSGVSTYTSTGTWPCPTGNNVTLDFDDLGFDVDAVNAVLVDLAALSNTNCSLDLTGNAAPGAAGLAAKTTLEGRGWTVSVASE